jgi:GntR family transcriptional regulator
VQIADVLRGRILAGAYVRSQPLPSEHEIATRLGVSRGTARRAIGVLRDSGYAVARRGSGTYVADELPIAPLERSGILYTGYLEALTDEAREGSDTQRDRRHESADAETAARLRLEVGDPVTRFEAVRVRDGTTYGFAIDVVPADVAARIDVPTDRSTRAVYDLLGAAGTPVVQSLQRVEPAHAPAEVAARIGLTPGDAVLLVEGIGYTAERRPVDAYRLYIAPGYGISLLLTRAVG